MPSIVDWAYAAGLVDGEGSIGVYQSHRQPGRERSPVFIVRVSVINTDEGVIKWMQDTFGGRFYARKKILSRHRVVYIWALDGQFAANFLNLIHPYLRIKKAQAWLLQEAWAQRGNLRRKDDPDEVGALRKGFVIASSYLNKGGVAC